VGRKTIFSNSSCLRCGKNSLLTDAVTGEQFCSKCGYVISEKVDASGPEWRSFQKAGGADPTRTGSPTSLAMHDRGLATIISPMNKDASGKPLTSAMKSTIQRLRTWDSRSKTNTSLDKNLIQALSELSTLKDKLSLSDAVIEKASYIYRKALEKSLVRGRSISALIAAALYAACRDAETPRTLKDITNAANVSRKDIARCYRIIVVDPVHCVARIASNLEITEKTKRYAVKIIKDAQERKESSGKEPMGFAASALYLSCVENKVPVTQRDMAEAANVTEVTIRNRCKELRRTNIEV
jgi:transcription initiation factor TFIIB